MRVELTLNRTTKQRMLPMDYQYYISAWIYNVIRQADKPFAEFLHDRGYGDKNKPYKLFCFNRLNIGKPKLWSEKKLFEMQQDTATLQVSFYVHKAASNFIKGLFMAQEFYLGDRFNGIDFRVTQVTVLDEPKFESTMHYRLRTPWVVSLLKPDFKHPTYLKADDPEFIGCAEKHIVEKAKNIIGTALSEADLSLKLTSESKRSGFRIKPDTPQESRVVGNLFSFELCAPLEVHQLIWSAGVSEKSSSGFGWLEVK